MKEYEFFERVTAVWLELHSLQEQAAQLSQQIAALEQAGFVNATIHIRKDNGGMELLHPMGSEYEVTTGRRREYVGTKPEAQEVAKARVQRYHEWHKTSRQLAEVMSKVNRIQYQLARLEMITLGKQMSFLEEMGTNDNPATPQRVPNVRDISPMGVIDYFKQSPDLMSIADDVMEVLGKAA